MHRRLALPASCLVFGILGASLGLQHVRSGRSRGITVCIAVLLLHYALLTAGRALGARGLVAPELAMWVPNLLLAALAGFAFVALSLAMIGLFGLAAFMAAQRTKEIGVRKVLGASSAQIARLLVWQFSKPVLWGLVVALPLAYVASMSYLNFFADRIGTAIPILLVAGLVSVLLAWGTVAAHAIRIARANPVYALRYE